MPQTTGLCRRAVSCVSTAAVLSLSTLAHAGTGVWTTGGPYGGQIMALTVDPMTPATLYAGTAWGGVFKSTNSGGNWVASNTGLTDLWVHALAIDPTTPSTLYAGAIGEICKSTNSGGNWVEAGVGGYFVWAIAIDPVTPSTLYAGTGGGVLKSTDSGATWTATGLTSEVNALAIDPTTPATLYAGLWSDSGGLFKSTDSGDTWTAASLPSHYVNALAIDPTTTATLYAGTLDGGVFKSTNSGATWTATGLTSYVSALAVDPTTPSTLYAATDDGVFKSTNSGATWTAANTGLTNSRPSALAIDPASPATLYAGTGRGGVFKSTNSGATWTAANTNLTNWHASALAIDPTSPATLYAGGDGVSKSTNSGSTWAVALAPADTGLTEPAVVALAIDPTTPSTLYAATDGGGLFKSTNSGGDWVDAGVPGYFVWAVAIDPVTPTTLYAGGFDGVYKSTNSGATWTATGLTSSVVALAIDPTTPSTLYAATDGGVFKSTNSGNTWTAAGLPSQSVNALAIDPTTPSTLYAATDGGIFKSTNSGSTWTAVNSGLTASYVLALAIDPTIPSTLYAGTNTDGVFRSTNSGTTWTAVNRGLTDLWVRALAIDPTTPSTLYAGTYGGGVWQSSAPSPAESDMMLTLSDSPDPVIGTTPLTYTISVTNSGPDPASSVFVSQTLPAGVVFDSATGSGWICSQFGATCGRPTLSVGAAPDIAVKVTTGPAATVLSSSAGVYAAEIDPNPANNSDTETTTVLGSGVSIGTRTKTVLADSGKFVINGGLTYTITLTNTGTSTQADNPGHELVDTLPSSLALVSAGATSGSATSDLASNTITWDGSLASGGSVVVTIHATIAPTVALGATIANQGTIHYDADANGTNEATALTDDPAVAGDSDPTRFTVVSPATDFYTLAPCRAVDTRWTTDPVYGGPALVAGAGRVFPLFGRCDIPSSARALSVNVTVTGSTVAGNLRLYPAGSSLPQASSVNYSAGQTRANNAIVPLNGLGQLAVYCAQSSGTAHFILDVNGYFEEGTR